MPLQLTPGEDRPSAAHTVQEPACAESLQLHGCKPVAQLARMQTRRSLSTCRHSSSAIINGSMTLAPRQRVSGTWLCQCKLAQVQANCLPSPAGVLPPQSKASGCNNNYLPPLKGMTLLVESMTP